MPKVLRVLVRFRESETTLTKYLSYKQPLEENIYQMGGDGDCIAEDPKPKHNRHVRHSTINSIRIRLWKKELWKLDKIAEHHTTGK